MTLIKKCDVESHFAAQRWARMHPLTPASQPDATGFSGPEPGAIRAIKSKFAKDFLGEHSSPGKTVAPRADIALPSDAVAPLAAGSAQA
jgi:hypothetical protein